MSEAPTFYANLTGVSFRNEAERAAVADFDVGQVLRLEREPDNAYDENAVKVIYEDPFSGVTYHVGYIEKGIAASLARWLDAEIEYSCTTHSPIAKKMTPWLLELLPV